MARARSPEYPAISLKEAIDRVKMVYDKDYQNRLPKKVIAEHMGYKSLSGASLPVLAALAKYGLLEGRGDETRVSDLAVSIIAHAPGTPERMEALKQASALPELFAELDGRFQSGKASDQAIRSYLLTQKFIPSAADAAIRAYRDTKALVENGVNGYSSAPSEPEKSPVAPEKQDVAQHGPKPSSTRPKGEDMIPPPAGMRKAVFALAEGDVTLTFPEGLSAESVEDLEGYIEILLRKVRRDAAKPADDIEH